MIGRALVQRLLLKGERVIALMRPDGAPWAGLPWHRGLTVLPYALSEYEKCLPDASADVFVHLAWAGTTGELREDAEVQQKNIKYTLNISNNISTVDLINIDDNLLLDICKIIGVYLDNSIEAVTELEDKYVSLEMYMQDSNLVISISNNYLPPVSPRISFVSFIQYSSASLNVSGFDMSYTTNAIFAPL
jgi:hypothetical protein